MLVVGSIMLAIGVLLVVFNQYLPFPPLARLVATLAGIGLAVVGGIFIAVHVYNVVKSLWPLVIA